MAWNSIPSFPALAQEIGEAGVQLTTLGAAEGSAGNISVFVRQLQDLDERFRASDLFDLPVSVPSLAGGWLLVSGTGCRLRDLASSPDQSLCCLEITEGGDQARQYAAGDVRPTSELNSHLAIHNKAVAMRSLAYHSVVHAQPAHLTYLSHHPVFTNTTELNRRLMRWEPETILVFPEGIGVVAFQVPGSPEQMQVTLESLRLYRAVIWQKHGIVTRSDESVRKAADLVEYAETAARYEYLNLLLGEPSQGLTEAELRAICTAFKINYPL